MDALSEGPVSGERRRRLLQILRLGSVPKLGRARAARWIRSEGGLPGALARARREVAPPLLDADAAEAELDRLLAACASHEIRPVLHDDPEYPPSFEHLADPPPLLFLRGRPLGPTEPAVAVVGSREATEYGRTIARDLGRGLASTGVCVVSGMALGVDGAAHLGALEADGRTIALLGRGADRAYPSSHHRLMGKILGAGALWTEYAPGVGPRRHHFPERNRLIAGMVRAVVVVQAAARSGALITARLGLEAGIDVWAVPGRIDVDVSRGVNALIRDGARPVCSVAEVVDAYAATPRSEGSDRPTGVSPLAESVWDRLSDGAAGIDELVARWAEAFPGTGPVLAALAELEVGGWVVRRSDASWARRAA